MPVTVRMIACSATFADAAVEDIISVRGEVSADGGWPTCSLFVTHKPTTGNEEDGIQVVAGAGNDVIRFQGRVRRFRSSGFPKGIEIVSTGTLAYATGWTPDEDILFSEAFPAGSTDEALVRWALDHVPGITYVSGNIDGTGITLGTEAPDAFDWKVGTSAWIYIQKLDRATLFRTYQTHDGAIMRVRMVGHPDVTPDFTLAPEDILDGATGERNTERTRNFVRVVGHDYGNGLGPVVNGAGNAGSNDFQGDASDPAHRQIEEFSSDLIESGTDPDDGTWDGNAGLRADQLGAAILPDVNKEFVEAQIPSWRDDLHGPGLTVLLDALNRLAIGEPMWVQKYAWEVGDNGWMTTYTLTGGGLPQTYDPPPV